ncbi:MAG TPA: hypothetical protein VGS19_33200 [Streptosporangiaceae bacterium]|nr:hypothetical protein [Streptosporangiaceae bacterium]
MSEYQYYEFLALDRPLTTREQAEIRQLSTRARITATSFTNEYHWGDFRGSPQELMRCYYDAHLYLANWGTHRIMLRLPRTLLSPQTAERYQVEGLVDVSSTREHMLLEMTSEDETGEWVEDAEDSLSAIAGVRAELAAGDMRPLYLAWLAAYGVWERDEDSFGDEHEEAEEPPVPAGLGALSASQRALADFLRLDPDLLTVAAQASPALPEVRHDTRALSAHIAKLPVKDKDKLLMLVATDQPARARMELLRGFGSAPAEPAGSRPLRTVAELLDTAAEVRMRRERKKRLRPRPSERLRTIGARWSGTATWTNSPRIRRPPGPRPSS